MIGSCGAPYAAKRGLQLGYLLRSSFHFLRLVDQRDAAVAELAGSSNLEDRNSNKTHNRQLKALDKAALDTGRLVPTECSLVASNAFCCGMLKEPWNRKVCV